MSFFNKFKENIENMDLKKVILNLVAIIIFCSILLISWSSFFPEEEKTINDNRELVTTFANKNEDIMDYKDSLDIQLEKILEQIDGVGQVDVMITYETSAEVVPAMNVTKSTQTTEESDRQGGTRIISQENTSENIVTVSSSDYKNSPIVIKEIKPVVRGVIVVAEGASDPVIKNNLIDAVTTVFQVKSNKVKVYEKK